MRTLFLLSFAASLLVAQDWQNTANLPGIDFTGLSPAQKTSALKILREQGCSCGCDMKVAECRVKDPVCGVSRSLAAMVIKELKAGKSPAEVGGMLAEEAKKGPAPRPLLEEPVSISTEGDPVRGPANAKITIVEFSDFQCPYCAVAAGKVNTLLTQNKDVKLVFKQFPLDIHGQARLAAQASLAAGAQGKFWELHDKMFANYRKLSRENILAWAKDIGLDVPKFTQDLENPAYKKTVTREMNEGVNLGVSGTPSFFINGKKYNGPIEPEQLKPILDAERAGKGK